ncbi:Polynucleotide kinase 3 phosphatase [Penicillium hispanicum]|uniref:Polynucleotide kinase 3 phosphatase n=1 Tax=Penicillium hispanicum TaxID=1080232 RepID=UPI002540DDF3|nr:Polynucleotide kinase 3 phosphatase [Penicillium hispanicum]KAJ5585232.1 Polynucleotide kinase 3 phosphatase [Penicillium hispanicum]
MAEGGAKRPASPTRTISPPPLRRKVEATVTKKSVANFFAPTSQKKPEPITWRVIGTSAIIGKYVPENKAQNQPDKERRIAAFDLDSTLIRTASGKTFPRSATDWKWWDATIPGRLRELDSEGYQVVIFSNQKMISIQKDIKAGRADSKSLAMFKEKLATIMTQLEIPMSVYAATTDPEYRKPRLGMWREFIDDYDLDVAGIDLAKSFFVGDAAGRPGDHSAADRGFAANAGMPFKTPEEYFLKQAPQAVTGVFDPTSYIKSDPNEPPTASFTRKHPLELVIFCGSPGSGKSTYFWNNLQPLGYERVNQDLLKTRPKCVKVAREHLEAKRSVAVDNTNADPETRLVWTTLAKELKVPIRCVHFLSPPELCRHNNAVRAANKELVSSLALYTLPYVPLLRPNRKYLRILACCMNPESRSSLPGIAFGDFARRFRAPTLDEGFEDIVPVKFRFQGDEEARKLWGQYWV